MLSVCFCAKHACTAWVQNTVVLGSGNERSIACLYNGQVLSMSWFCAKRACTAWVQNRAQSLKSWAASIYRGSHEDVMGRRLFSSFLSHFSGKIVVDDQAPAQQDAHCIECIAFALSMCWVQLHSTRQDRGLVSKSYEGFLMSREVRLFNCKSM